MYAVGALLNSALYLLCVFGVGLVTGNRFAWSLAIAAMGVTYLSHLAMAWAVSDGRFYRRATALVKLSIALGAIAGIALLF